MIEYKMWSAEATPPLSNAALPALDQLIELYVASTLGERRPVDDRERMATMFRHANLVVTAWDGDLLVGVSRSVTDFVWCTYLADVGSSRVDLQACKLEYSIVSPK